MAITHPVRPTAGEMRETHRRLSDWLSPHEMKEQVVRFMERFGNGHAFFKQSGTVFAREAWVAAKFGEQRGASAARLVGLAEERPDFVLRFEDSKSEIYELVEADRLGRKRTDKYAALAAAGWPTYHIPIEEWATPEQAFAAIRKRAEDKAKKAEGLALKGTPYPPRTGLVINLNLWDFGAHTQEIENVFSEAVEPAQKWFSSIWVFWNDRAYEVWADDSRWDVVAPAAFAGGCINRQR